VSYTSEIHEGEHEAIIDDAVFQRVQTMLARNARSGDSEVRKQFWTILKGLLRCTACDVFVVPSHTNQRGKRYRYYVCSSAQKRGWTTCPSKSVPTGEMEHYVVAQIRGLGSDPEFADGVIEQLLRSLIHRIEYHGGTGRLELIFEPTGFDGLLQQLTCKAFVP